MKVTVVLLIACAALAQAQRPPPPRCQSQCPSQGSYPAPSITNDSTYIYIKTSMCPPYSNPHWTNPSPACIFDTTYRIPLHPKDAGIPIPLAQKLEVFESVTYLKEDPAPLLGAIGVLLNGVNIFGVGSPCGYSSKCPGQGGPSKYVDAVDSEGHTVDQCGGHPAPTHQYHIHSGVGLTTDQGRNSCRLSVDKAGQHSALLGYLLDGYGLYGKNSLNGTLPMDLDECGGHTHVINGANTYHYHLPSPPKFPWTVGCFKGCPETSNNPREFDAFTNPPYNCPK